MHGKPRHSQSQGSVERCNQDVESILACFRKDNNTNKWSECLSFVQWKKNSRYHSGIGQAPYEAMFGQPPKVGIKGGNLPDSIADKINSEEELQQVIEDSTSSKDFMGIQEDKDEEIEMSWPSVLLECSICQVNVGKTQYCAIADVTPA